MGLRWLFERLRITDQWELSGEHIREAFESVRNTLDRLTGDPCLGVARKWAIFEGKLGDEERQTDDQRHKSLNSARCVRVDVG